jgi:formylglycine-generating enzyme required for sulfatase activity
VASLAELETPAVAPPPAPKQVVNSIGMKLVLISPGRFLMGSPPGEAERGMDEAQHERDIRQPFYLGAHEVTQAQYAQVTKKNPSWFAFKGGGQDQVRDLDTRAYPVDSVSWKEATEYCRLLSDVPAEKAAGRGYRLPTEAEWEYACRAGTVTAFHFGSVLDRGRANFDGPAPYEPAVSAAAGSGVLPAREPPLGRPAPVGSYPPNAWGLHDMHGNVYEWCSDWYAPSPEAVDATGLHRVMRGGSFLSAAGGCRSALRGQAEPNSRSLCVGFRVTCELKPR